MRDLAVLMIRDAIKRREREKEYDDKERAKEEQLRREKEQKEEERRRQLEEKARLELERKEKLKGRSIGRIGFSL